MDKLKVTLTVILIALLWGLITHDFKNDNQIKRSFLKTVLKTPQLCWLISKVKSFVKPTDVSNMDHVEFVATKRRQYEDLVGILFPPQKDPWDTHHRVVVDNKVLWIPREGEFSKIKRKFPVVVRYPGGGFIMHVPRPIEAQFIPHVYNVGILLDVVVVDVAYSVVPEHSLEEVFQSAYEAYKWVISDASEEYSIDRDEVILTGESAGAAIALQVAVMARDAKIAEHIMAIAAFMPVGQTPSMDIESYKENGEGYGTSATMLMKLMEVTGNYTKYPQDTVMFLNPKVKADSLPPTTIVSQRYDPLRTDAELIHAKLVAAGVKSKLIELNGMHATLLADLKTYKEIMINVVESMYQD